MGTPVRRHQNAPRPPLEGVAVLLMVILLLGPTSCLSRRSEPTESPAGPAGARAVEEPSTTSDYIIGSGDVLNILVYGEPDLTVVSRVSNEGFIELPLIGRVRASGRTAPELKQAIEAKFKQGYLVNPSVQVLLQDYKQNVVHLMGQVATPGPYRITHSNTLMGTISKAGGFTPIAKRNKVKIIRREDGGSRVFYVDTLRITKDGKLEDDVLLKPGDVIIVPERFF